MLGLLAGQQLIRDMIRKLVASNAKLEQLYSQQNSFVSNVAHEFRAPLTIVKGSLDNLADGLHGSLSADQTEPVTMCQREVNRLKRLVGDLLDLARIDAGRMPLAKDEVVLQEVLQAVGQLFSASLKERNLHLALELPGPPAKVTGDRDRLQQVFVNLVTNAMKFTPAGGVSIRLLRDDEAFQVEVEDTGRGIAEEHLERVFNKFERVGEISEEGSGLGLPIARDIVELHQGRIWAESQLGKGSRFIVRLPARRAIT
jgi:signal transduction histidine kinase